MDLGSGLRWFRKKQKFRFDAKGSETRSISFAQKQADGEGAFFRYVLLPGFYVANRK
jgi:hypothetical protein